MYNVNSECELHTCLCLELWRDCALIQICFLILSTLTMVLLSNCLSRQFNLRVSWNTLPYLICYETAQIIDPVSCGTDSLHAWGHLNPLQKIAIFDLSLVSVTSLISTKSRNNLVFIRYLYTSLCIADEPLKLRHGQKVYSFAKMTWTSFPNKATARRGSSLCTYTSLCFKVSVVSTCFSYCCWLRRMILWLDTIFVLWSLCC